MRGGETLACDECNRNRGLKNLEEQRRADFPSTMQWEIKYVLEFRQGRLARVHQRVATSESRDFGYP